MSARSQILDGIRRSLHRGGLTGDARAAVDQRLAAPPRGPLVARAQLPQPEKVALFCQWAEANNATVARVAAGDVASEVSAYLARNNLPAEAVMAPAAALDAYDWAGQRMLSLRRGRG
ncbi:MAG TPA: lactate utilization protein, partial [Reyranella sp.]